MNIFKARAKEDTPKKHTIIFVSKNTNTADRFLEDMGLSNYEVSFIGTTLLYNAGSIILMGYEK